MNSTTIGRRLEDTNLDTASAVIAPSKLLRPSSNCKRKHFFLNITFETSPHTPFKHYFHSKTQFHSDHFQAHKIYLLEKNNAIRFHFVFFEKIGLWGNTEWNVINTGSCLLECLGISWFVILLKTKEKVIILM